MPTVNRGPSEGNGGPITLHTGGTMLTFCFYLLGILVIVFLAGSILFLLEAWRDRGRGEVIGRGVSSDY
jgi:hypothetical protein